MDTWSKPVLLVSRCLGFEACRYNGAIIQNDFIDQLKQYCDLITVCPEKEIGLGIPRKPIRLVTKDNQIYLKQHETNLDVTDKMKQFASNWIEQQPIMNGAILKGRSPSCGVKNVKIYDELTGNPLPAHEKGLFVQSILQVRPDLLMEEEGRLIHQSIREHFLTRLFGNADFTEISKDPSLQKLLAFHTRYKLILMHYNQNQLKIMGRILADAKKNTLEVTFQTYKDHLNIAWGKPPRCQSVIHVLLHVLGYFKNQLSLKEKAYFLDLIEAYREAKIQLRVLTQVLETWILHYQIEYLSNQRFFNAYPKELISIENSGKAEVCLE